MGAERVCGLTAGVPGWTSLMLFRLSPELDLREGLLSQVPTGLIGLRGAVPLSGGRATCPKPESLPLPGDVRIQLTGAQTSLSLWKCLRCKTCAATQ